MDVETIMQQRIREKPGLYIGKPSLSLLNAFMLGYMLRHNEVSGTIESIKTEKSFYEYVKNYYAVSETTKGLCSIICENCLNDEEAFYKFFELWDEFNKVSKN